MTDDEFELWATQMTDEDLAWQWCAICGVLLTDRRRATMYFRVRDRLPVAPTGGQEQFVLAGLLRRGPGEYISPEEKQP